MNDKVYNVPEHKHTILDHGYVYLSNVSGPFRRPDCIFDADDTDPAVTARICFGNLPQARLREQELKLVRYLIAHKHTTPIEMIESWWVLKVPMAIGEQIIRHRTATINKISGRYAEFEGEWYIPDIHNIGKVSESNKQGRDLIKLEDLTNEEIATRYAFARSLQNHCEEGYALYKDYLSRGIPAELCRFFLSANQYTVFWYKQDLHNLMHFLNLRLDGHAQYEAQVVAQAIYSYLRTYLPNLMQYFDEYRRDS